MEKELDNAEKQKLKALEEREALKPQREALEQSQRNLTVEKQRLSDFDLELKEREKNILEREADAEAGFTQLHIDKLNELKRSQQELRQTYATQITELENTRRALAEEYHQKQIEWQKTQDATDSELAAREKEIERQERDLKRERDLLEEDRESLQESLEQRTAAERERFEHECAALKSRLAVATEIRNETDLKLQQLEEIFRCIQPQNPEDLLKDLKDLKEEKRKLQLELENRLTSESQTRLQELERYKETADTEKGDLYREISRLKTQLSKFNISATELETAKRQLDAYQANIDLLKTHCIEKTRETRELVEGKKADIAFPSLTRMDEDSELTETITAQKVTDLEKLVVFTRNVMAQGEDPRFYDEKVVRSFIGGMAMSRLHLLHGISGTGKTSLPLAFAKAIGAGVQLIEVQAGWRDRDDLFGYYNSFEKKYYESEFLQALYKAQCPAFRDRPFIIVLDEMNLSHPEQYFADVLSALENPDRKRFNLMTSGIESHPEGLVEDGKSIDLPNNVWFVGTANQDETTKDFADKSYDRAHVMELADSINPFEPVRARGPRQIDFNSMEEAFLKAVNKCSKETAEAWGFLNSSEIKTPLQKYFEIGWGPRLQRQLNRYLPVVVACGGNKGEALDHIIASKILRKLRNRYNNRAEHIQTFKETLETQWEAFDSDSLPESSLLLLESELHKLSNDA